MTEYWHPLQGIAPSTRFEFISDIAASAAVISPWWLPLLKETSEIASFLLPIFGVLWLAVQIGIKVYWFRKRRPNG